MHAHAARAEERGTQRVHVRRVAERYTRRWLKEKKTPAAPMVRAGFIDPPVHGPWSYSGSNPMVRQAVKFQSSRPPPPPTHKSSARASQRLHLCITCAGRSSHQEVDRLCVHPPSICRIPPPPQFEQRLEEGLERRSARKGRVAG